MRYITSLISSILVLASCTEDIDLSLSSCSSQLVIDAHICDITTPYNYVHLSMSTDYFSNQQSPAVSGATVTISDGYDEYKFIECDKKGYYMAPEGFYGKHNRTYTLQVTNIDTNNDGINETYSATEPMPPTYEIDSVVCVKNSFSDFYMIKFYAYEDVESKNFYMFGYSYNDSLITDTYTKFSITSDELFSSNYCWGATIAYLSDNDLCNGTVTEGDKVTVYAMSINESFYNYNKAVSDIVNGSNPMFSSAPANAIGNINNGEALGFFAVFAVVDIECLVEQ